jgi:DNA mismatch endonuclease (patch repair protein)
MSQIKSKNTKPELIVRKFLFSKGFRYRIHDNKFPGKPDILLPKYKTAIFVHGCFWHGHQDCKYFVIPKTRTEWWLNKINGNKKNDVRVLQSIRQMNWRVLILWECDLKGEQLAKTLSELPIFLVS